jgi:hypothetical protein
VDEYEDEVDDEKRTLEKSAITAPVTNVPIAIEEVVTGFDLFVSFDKTTFLE